MKKIIIILILLPFLYFNIGYFPFFLIKQQIIKNEIEQKIKNDIPSSELTELIFDKTTYNSLKRTDENEFSYNDHMYDIVRIKTDKNNNIHLFCIDDKKESLLMSQLYEQTKTNEKNQQNSEELFFKLFSKDYLKVNPLTLESSYIIINRFAIKKDIYKSFIPDKPSPPPKFC